MKIIRIHEYGGSDKLHLDETPQPTPNPGQVLVRVHDAGVNPVDWKLREGYLRGRLPDSFPLAMGQDIAGDVVSAAGDANGLQPGDRVFGFATGAYAEYALAEAALLARIPHGMSDETAAALPTPGLTAYQLVRSAEAHLHRVLVLGGAGAVGSIAVQLAKLRAAQVFATAVDDDDLAFLKQLNVDAAIDGRRENFGAMARDLDVVIDLIGGETQRQLPELIKPGGQLLSTVGVDQPAEEAARKRGVRTAAFVMQRSGHDLAALADIVERHRFRIRIARVLPFEQARQAQDLLQSGRAHGKVMLKVA